ncbi:hypothetical protein [Serratia marcescens]|uniref:hypothetical protein n=1 Tax=Serratia marcescens TaxID=615 RepID=UPI000AC2EB77|nr:hypothetical protein [Serratia marcescens]
MIYNEWPIASHRFKKFITPVDAFANYWREEYMQKLSIVGVYNINKKYSLVTK